MSGRQRKPLALLACGALLLTPWLGAAAGDKVAIVATPDGGIQPQAVADAGGTLHLIYFKGAPASGDLYYVRRAPDATEFSRPVRVNSQPGSAIAVGTIRGGQLAVGRGGRVHVVWNGAPTAAPARSGLFYSRLDETRTAFEPQLDLLGQTSALDGGATIAADLDGRVIVAWHARSADSVEGEMGRKVWIARSTDSGASFAPERPAWNRPTGACACCASRALADSRGQFVIFYRAATRGTERDMYLLFSDDHAEHFRGRSLQPWIISTCPMSSESLADTPSGVLAAWETQGQVYFTRIDRAGEVAFAPQPAPGRGLDRKHPAIAANSRGEVLLAWTEGTGWQKGGSLAWQLFDPSGRPTDAKGTLPNGIPVWGLPTVVTRPDGSFMVIH